MSHVTQHPVSLPLQVRSHRAVWLGAALLAAIGAVALVLALSGGAIDQSISDGSGASAPVAARPDGGPAESGIAAAIAARRAALPDESGIAASIGGGASVAAGGPDESRVAASIGGAPHQAVGGPDESRTAASISGG